MKKIFLPCLCIFLMTMASCTKPGTGGKATLSIHVFDGVCDGSNRTVVAEAVVYIKYGGMTVDTDLSSYDDFQMADVGGKTVFQSLRRGDYYLYGVSPDGTKTGGTHFEINNRIGEREVVICTGSF